MIYNYIGKTLAIYLLSRQGLSGIHRMWLMLFDLQSWIWLWDPTVLIGKPSRICRTGWMEVPVTLMSQSWCHSFHRGTWAVLRVHTFRRNSVLHRCSMRGKQVIFLSLSFCLSPLSMENEENEIYFHLCRVDRIQLVHFLLFPLPHQN